MLIMVISTIQHIHISRIQGTNPMAAVSNISGIVIFDKCSRKSSMPLSGVRSNVCIILGLSQETYEFSLTKVFVMILTILVLAKLTKRVYVTKYSM